MECYGLRQIPERADWRIHATFSPRPRLERATIVAPMPESLVTSPSDHLAFALDVPTLGEAEAWIGRLGDGVGVYKVGLELFAAAGRGAIDTIHAAGARCFLDLKLHDIAATMGRTATVIADLGVSYFTIHAAAGPEALETVARAVEGTGSMPLAVTVLTSLDASALEAVGMQGGPEEAVVRLARLAHGSGVRGLVCSPRECVALREALGDEPTLVVPGIRPAGAALGDQKRVSSPGQAIRDGADLLVVGRPIRDAAEPRMAADAIVTEIAEALR